MANPEALCHTHTHTLPGESTADGKQCVKNIEAFPFHGVIDR